MKHITLKNVTAEQVHDAIDEHRSTGGSIAVSSFYPCIGGNLNFCPDTAAPEVEIVVPS